VVRLPAGRRAWHVRFRVMRSSRAASLIVATALVLLGTAVHAAENDRRAPGRTPPPPLFATPPAPVFGTPPSPLFGSRAARAAVSAGRLSWFVPDLRTADACGVARSPYDAMLDEVADRYALEHALVHAVVRAESNFDPVAVSPKGALGLMQLMPGTAARHHVRNPFLPRENVEGGCRELRDLLDRYAGNLPLALAAYNAGPQRVEDAGGVPAIAETREYLARVLAYRAAYRRAAGVAGDPAF